MWDWITRREERRQLQILGELGSRATKSVGYWSHQSEPSSQLPRAQDYVDPEWDPEIRAQVIRHLLNGEAFLSCLGYSECRFCGTNNGTCDMTDGVYFWPEGFVHYLQEHAVRPPDEFVEHVLNSDGTAGGGEAGGIATRLRRLATRLFPFPRQ